MDNTPSTGKDELAGAITRLTTELQTAQQHNNRPLCQEILSNAVLAFETDPEALDRTLFDVFGTVVHFASSECCNLVQRYLQLVSDHCSGREVMTLLMSSLDNISGSVWQAESTLLADAAINVLSKLKRQQTRLLADYLQVFLNATETVILSEALLKSTASTLLGLQKMLPPISQEKHAHENQKLSSCFALQLMLQHTLTQPMQQTHEFHRAPDYNADLPNQTQHKHLHNESSLHLKLVQCLVKWLQHWHCGTCKQLMFLLDSLHDPESSSKLLPVDDVPFLDINQLRVAAALVTYAIYCVPGCAATGSAANPHLASPETAEDIMSATQQHAGLLLHVASDQQDVVIAQKGMALIAAAANQVAAFPQGGKAALSSSVQSLAECLEITMVQHPLLSLRNMAFWSLDALLNALQVMHDHL